MCNAIALVCFLVALLYLIEAVFGVQLPHHRYKWRMFARWGFSWRAVAASVAGWCIIVGTVLMLVCR